MAVVLDEFFPEYEEVFTHPLTGKASQHILKTCPFPKFIIELGEEGVTAEIRKAVKKTESRTVPARTKAEPRYSNEGEKNCRACYTRWC